MTTEVDNCLYLHNFFSSSHFSLTFTTPVICSGRVLKLGMWIRLQCTTALSFSAFPSNDTCLSHPSVLSFIPPFFCSEPLIFYFFHFQDRSVERRVWIQLGTRSPPALCPSACLFISPSICLLLSISLSSSLSLPLYKKIQLHLRLQSVKENVIKGSIWMPTALRDCPYHLVCPQNNSKYMWRI